MGQRTKIPEVEAFIAEDLGMASSHPRFARRKARLFLHLPTLVVAIIGLWVVLKGAELDFSALIEALLGHSKVVTLLLCLLVFAFSLAATSILSIRASLTTGLSMLRSESSHVSFKFSSIIVLMLGAALAAILLFYLPRLLPAGMGEKGVRYGFILAFMPYVLTLAMFDVFTPGQRSKFWGAAVFLTALLVGILVAISYKAEWAVLTIATCHMKGLPLVGDRIASLTGAPAQLFFRILAALVSLLFVSVLGEWTISGIPSPDTEERKDELREEEQLGFIARIARFLRRIFGIFRGAKAEPETEEKKAPEWLESICKAMPGALKGVVLTAPGPLARQEIPKEKKSRSCLNPSRDMLFGGVRPTEDQFKAMELFIDRGRVCIGNVTAGDLLLEGENGVGKTTTLLACALQTLLIKGEKSVVFAPDATSRRLIVESLRMWLDGLLVGHCFRIEELNKSMVSVWLSSPQDFPDILVSSPEDWEDSFFGELCDELKPEEPAMSSANAAWGQKDTQSTAEKDKKAAYASQKQIHKWLLGITTMLVDDVANVAWTNSHVTHLPFILDKHRLLLGASGRKMQLLATTTRLEEVESGAGDPDAVESVSPVRVALIRRLFCDSEAPRLGQNYFLLKTWQRFEPDRVEVKCVVTDPVIFHIVRCALRLKKRVFLYLPVEDKDQRQQRQDDFCRRMQDFWNSKSGSPGAEPEVVLSPDNFRIVCHVNEQITSAAGGDESRVIIYQGTLDDNIRPQLFSRYGSENSVVFALNQLSSKGTSVTKTRPMGYPMFVSRQAMPVAVAHLRSAAVHLAVGLPLRRDDMTLCGVGRSGMIPNPRTSPVSGWHADSSFRFNLDPPAFGKGSELESQDIWPMACFAPEGFDTRSKDGHDWHTPSRKVVSRDLLDFGLGYQLSEDGFGIEFGRFENENENGRRAVWADANGKDIQHLDLAFCDELTATRGEQKYRCQKLQIDSKGRWLFSGLPLVGAARTQPTTSYWNICLEPRFGANAVEGGGQNSTTYLGIDGPWQGSPRKVHVVDLFLRVGESTDMSTGRVPAFDADISIVGAFSELDRGKRDGFVKPARFGFHAAVTAMLLNAPVTKDNEAEDIGRLLARSWDTSQTSGDTPFWPELTLAIQSGFRSFAPRCTHFCRFAAFRLGNGGAVVFFIEPIATSGTMRPLLEMVLQYPDLARDKICDPAVDALVEKDWSGPGFTDETPLEKEPEKARRLIRLLGPAKYRIPPKNPPQEGDDKVPTPSLYEGLPTPPFRPDGIYYCGKCGKNVNAPNATPSITTNCGYCGIVLFSSWDTVSDGPRYPMQLLGRNEWPGNKTAKAGPGTKDRVAEIWMNVAKAVTYELDEKLHGGRADVAQTAVETLKSGKGDCEDHSILLLDWLITEGYDARLTWGDSTIDGKGWGGHSWVVLLLEDSEYIIEATKKVSGMAGSDETLLPFYKLEDIRSLEGKYKPKYMCDAQRFWERKEGAEGESPRISYWEENQWEEGMWIRVKS